MLQTSLLLTTNSSNDSNLYNFRFCIMMQNSTNKSDQQKLIENFYDNSFVDLFIAAKNVHSSIKNRYN